MVLGLTALGEGRIPIRIRLAAAMGHIIGAIVGGAVVSAGIWLMATPVRTLVPITIVASAVLAAVVVAIAIDARLVHVQNRSGQVPARWRQRYGVTRSYGLYGLMFGTAFATLRPHAVTYPLFVALALQRSLAVAVVAGCCFGIGHTFLVGPASYVPRLSGQVLFYNRVARRLWTSFSIAVTLGLALLVVQGAGA